jgi:hypothetical protein
MVQHRLSAVYSMFPHPQPAAVFAHVRGVQIIVMRQKRHDCGLTQRRFAIEIDTSRNAWSGK